MCILWVCVCETFPASAIPRSAVFAVLVSNSTVLAWKKWDKKDWKDTKTYSTFTGPENVGAGFFGDYRKFEMFWWILKF